MVTQAPFLFLLVDVDRNSATFAVLTRWTRSDGSLEVRVPSPNSDENITKVIDDKFDKSAPHIRGWRDFYSWLGRGGWARFSPDDGAKLIPGWLAPATEYVCTRVVSDSVRFVEESIRAEWQSRLGEVALMGTSPEDDAMRPFNQFVGNMVLAKRPLF